jgi:hypothetical protein
MLLNHVVSPYLLPCLWSLTHSDNVVKHQNDCFVSTRLILSANNTCLHYSAILALAIGSA